MAHILLFPFPSQSHAAVMLKLAELLTRADLFVTFVNTEHVHRRFLGLSPACRLSKLRFRTVPDGLPDDDPRSVPNFIDLLSSLRTRSTGHYVDLLVRKDGHRRDSEGWPPVTCVVASDIFPFAQEVAEEVGVPVMLLRTSSACSSWTSCSIAKLMERGEFPFAGKEADMDEPVRGIKGTENILRRRDLPSLTRQIKYADDPNLQFMLAMRKRLATASAIIINTMNCLEPSALLHMSSLNPNIYAVGPLHNLIQNFGSGNPSRVDSIPSRGVSQWEADRSCLTWLDSQPSKSVVYVSFGSIAVVSRETLVEFWHGLVNSGHQFLWVIRPDMVKGGEAVPEELEAATRERGCLVPWAPQVEVLAHRSVGCFLTHSGWNSTMESIAAGVPMICWPFFADQHTNSRFVSAVWKVGVDMKDLSGRRVVEEMVREVMEGEKAEELRKSASELSVEARRATEGGGSSYANFQKLVEHINSLSVEAAASE